MIKSFGMKGNTSGELSCHGMTSHLVGAFPMQRQMSSGKWEPYSALKCARTRLSSTQNKSEYEVIEQIINPLVLTFRHGIKLFHHSFHNILSSLSILPSPCNLE